MRLESDGYIEAAGLDLDGGVLGAAEDGSAAEEDIAGGSEFNGCVGCFGEGFEADGGDAEGSVRRRARKPAGVVADAAGGVVDGVGKFGVEAGKVSFDYRR